MFEVAALIFSLVGAGYVALKVTGKQSVLDTIGSDDAYNFTDHAGNRKYFSPVKVAAWKSTQDQITYILTSAPWQEQLHHVDFRQMDNGHKIDEIFRLIQENYSGALRGFGYGIGGDSFSYLDFYYPGIDIDHLGAGSETLFEIWLSNVNLQCIFRTVGTTVAAAAVTVASGGTLSVPAVAAAAAANSTGCAL